MMHQKYDIDNDHELPLPSPPLLPLIPPTHPRPTPGFPPHCWPYMTTGAPGADLLRGEIGDRDKTAIQGRTTWVLCSTWYIRAFLSLGNPGNFRVGLGRRGTDSIEGKSYINNQRWLSGYPERGPWITARGLGGRGEKLHTGHARFPFSLQLFGGEKKSYRFLSCLLNGDGFSYVFLPWEIVVRANHYDPWMIPNPSNYIPLNFLFITLPHFLWKPIFTNPILLSVPRSLSTTSSPSQHILSTSIVFIPLIFISFPPL